MLLVLIITIVIIDVRLFPGFMHVIILALQRGGGRGERPPPPNEALEGTTFVRSHKVVYAT